MEFIDSPEFTKDMQDLKFPNHELQALRLLLADDPMIGSQDRKYPGIMVLEWHNGLTLIEYCILKSGEICLITAYRKDEIAETTGCKDADKNNENNLTLKLKNVAVEIGKKVTVGAVVKVIYDYAKDLIKLIN
ncbi:MAG: hypothetical protein HQL76_09005 [Magnetococcales bacterium]|nr:hypothetical protein [Magnetococcales bacterium]